MKKLTIGLFNDSFPPNIDGVANTVVNYARIIQEKYGRSVVVAPKYKNVVDDYPFKVIRYQSFPTDKTRVRYRTGNPFSINALRKVSKENLDLIHCHSPFTATWLAKNATKEFDKAVRQAKLEWLEKFGFPYDELHMVKYGTTKANCTRKLGGRQILIDDNAKVRSGWTLGPTFDANKNVYEFLKNLRFGG